MIKKKISKKQPPPFLMLPEPPKQEYRFVYPKPVQVYEYFTLSNGCKRIFTDADGLCEYGFNKIIDPNEISYVNLFINGVLQPPENYQVECGLLILKTQDAPIRNAPIVLQMIKIM